MPAVKGLSKILVLGAVGVGKTSIIEQLVLGNYYPEKEMYSTIEDTYDAWLDTDKGQKERIRIYDIKGLDSDNPVLPTHYLQIVDAVMLVFSITSLKSFQLVEMLKTEIDKFKGKEFPIVVLGNKVDLLDSRECEHSAVIKWANKEKVKLFEVFPMSRNTLQEPVICLMKKVNANTGKANADMRRIIFRRGPGKNTSKDAS